MVEPLLPEEANNRKEVSFRMEPHCAEINYNPSHKFIPPYTPS